MKSRISTFYISTLAILWYIVTGDLMYEKTIDTSFLKTIFLFSGFLIFIYCALLALHNKDYSNLIILSLFTLINLFYLFEVDSGKFFYSPLFLFIGLILGKDNRFVSRFFFYNMIVLIIFTTLYYSQVYFIFTNGQLPRNYIIERRIFDYFINYNFYDKFSFSGLFGNSNSAGSLLFFLLVGVVEFSAKKKIFIPVLLLLLVLSGSITGILLGIIFLTYKYTLKKSKRVRSLFYVLGGVFSLALIYYAIQINPIGFKTRFQIWTEFPGFLLSNLYILIIPYNFIDSSYYVESTILDLLLNFGIIPVYLVIYELIRKKLIFPLILMIATNSSFLPLNALIIGILISHKNIFIKREISDQVKFQSEQ